MQQPSENIPAPRPFATAFYKAVALLILFGSFAGAWLMMDYRAFVATPLNLPEQGLTVTIAPGSSVRGIADDLAQRGVIDRPWLLVLLAYREGRAQTLKAGEYALNPGMRPRELLELFATGKVVQHSLTIVEGWTFRQLRAALAQHPVLEQTLAGSDDASLMARLGLPETPPEGWFLPDTYFFPRGTTDLEFLQRALHAMRQRLEREWQQRAADLPYQQPYDALIMASIVEKETAVAAERAQIAGVFVRRLQKGMFLQTDPTIIYGLGDRFDGDLKRDDLTRDNPFNTYTRAGLPPTPIALPGTAALHAALHPAAGDSLYFVSRGDGTHQFSATNAEHSKAVRKYQLKRGSANER